MGVRLTVDGKHFHEVTIQITDSKQNMKGEADESVKLRSLHQIYVQTPANRRRTGTGVSCEAPPAVEQSLRGSVPENPENKGLFGLQAANRTSNPLNYLPQKNVECITGEAYPLIYFCHQSLRSEQ